MAEAFDPRYECLMEPFDTWLVWDNLKDEPAMLSGVLLMGLDEKEARSICGLLNRQERVPSSFAEPTLRRRA